jgi:hypothetical protein
MRSSDGGAMFVFVVVFGLLLLLLDQGERQCVAAAAFCRSCRCCARVLAQHPPTGTATIYTRIYVMMISLSTFYGFDEEEFASFLDMAATFWVAAVKFFFKIKRIKKREHVLLLHGRLSK